MQRKTEAIILDVKPQSGSSALVVFFSEEFGKFASIVKGSTKKAPILQIGNIVDVSHFRRLDSQLGSASLELVSSPAVLCFSSLKALQVLSVVVEMLQKTLQEEEVHKRLYLTTKEFLLKIDEENLLERFAFYELNLLICIGYGLSISSDDAVGAGDGSELLYVSPRSGRAVSAIEGEPYKDKLLILPEIFGGKSKDINDAFALTGFFLEKALYGKELKARNELLK